MRRPLCVVCLAFAAVIGLLQGVGNPPLPSYGEAEGQIVTVTGQVYRKEVEQSEIYGEQQVLYLKDISSVQFQNTDWKTEYTEGVLCRLSVKSPGQGKCAPDSGDVPNDAGDTEDTVQHIGHENYSVRTGSTIVVQGELNPFERRSVPGGFDEAEYYQIQGCSFEIRKAKVLAAGEDYDRLGEMLFHFRIWAGSIFDKTLFERDASVLKAMLLGDKKGLDRDIKKLYQEAAISHILCISGLHITFLGMGLYRMCKRTSMPKPGAVLLCILVMSLYGRMTGMSSSAARAIFMFALILLAQLWGRSYDMLTALALSAVWILTEQPLYIRHSGFLLSFGAIMGLGIMVPVLQGREQKQEYKNACKGEKRSRRGKMRPGESCPEAVWNVLSVLKRNLAGGLGVFLVTLPILVQYFYEIAPYSLVLNLLVIPLSTILLPAGLLIPVLFCIYPPFAQLPAFFCHAILLVYEQGSRGSLALPGSRLTIGHVRTEQVAAYYLVLAGMIWLAEYAKGRLSWRMKALILTGAAAVLTMRVDEKGLQVIMLDVGQGDCFLVRDGRTELLVDGGSSTVKDVGGKRILPALKYYGCRELDYILLSHADEDHINGVTALLNEGEIRCRVLGVPDCAEHEKDGDGVRPVEQSIQAAFAGAGKPPLICKMKSGDRIRGGNFEITILHPQDGETFQDTNSTSLVFWLSGGDIALLFTGDLPGEKEELVLEEIERFRLQDRAIEKGRTMPVILKAAHHGSNGSTTEELLETLQPVITLISCGKNNSYGHPGKEMMERVKRCGSHSLITAEQGSVAVTADDGRITVKNKF